MAKKILVLLFIAVLSHSCDMQNDIQHQRAEYKFSEKDKLEYLIMNSDLICEIEVVGSAENHQFSFKTKEKKVKIKQVLKGNNLETNHIILSNAPLHDAPDTIHTRISLRTGNYIAFLSKNKSIYSPLTPYSLIEIYSPTNDGRPIWKQKNSKFIEIPDTPKEIIIKEVLIALESYESID